MATRILVINDDDSILDLFRMLLEQEEFEVVTSLETIENIQDVEQIAPDLVMLDLKMGMQQEGWIMMQKLRMYPPTSHLPIILCTAALEDARQQEETLRDKGIPIVYKPFDLEELLAAVRSVLPDSKEDEGGRKSKRR